MLKLIIGSSGTGKSTLLLERACANGGRNILLVPEPQSHETERRLCAVGGNRACLSAEVLTFSRLANRVFQTAGGLGCAQLDAGGRILLMYRAVQAVASRLKVYARPSRRPAFLTGLLATVDELKSCCISPDELSAAGQQIGGAEGERLGDLGLICASYEALTAQIALDPQDRLTRAAQKLEQCNWAQGARFYLDGFVDFTPQQLRVIELLLAQGESVTAALTCDHLEEDEDGQGVFSATRRTGAILQRMAHQLGQRCAVEVCTQPAPTRSLAMCAVERELFSTMSHGTHDCGDDVQIFCAKDMRTEVEWTAAKILELVREGGLRFRDIAVVARTYQRYDALIESVFSQYGVPVFRATMNDIMHKPVLTLVSAALDTVTGGYSYDDVFRYLKTDLTGFTREERDILENYVLKWDIRGSRWTQETPWNMHPGGYGLPMEEEDRAQLAYLDQLRRRMVEPLEKLRRNPNHTGHRQAFALYSFLEEIGLAERLVQRTDLLRQQGELGLAEEYRQLWEILCTALEQCARLLGDSPVELEEFAKLLQLVLSQYDVGTIPVSLDRVTAGEMSRLSGHGVQALFLLGADDGSIPAVSSDSGLLSDDDRELLAGVGVELSMRGKERLYREMTAVYTACTCPNRKLLITWPEHGGGQEMRPCFLVERLRRIFPEVDISREERGMFRLSAPRPALEKAGCIAEVRRVLEELPPWQTEIRRLEQAGRWERGSLSPRAVERLYGKEISMSASRMDKYKSCHFSYFMCYGLEAKPRRPAGFDAPEYGTFVHYVLEHVISDDGWRAQDGTVNADALKELTRRAVERYVLEELGGMEHQSARFRYLFDRLIGGVEQVVDNVTQELAASRFTPMAFELSFGRGKQLPPVEYTDAGVTINMTGFVDRVDGWTQGTALYLRVVDYKTGKKSFDLTEVSSGIGLQLLLYLFALQKQGEALFGKKIVPAGVLYLPARTARLVGSRSMSEQKRQQMIDQQLRRSGLVLDEAQVLDAMEHPGEGGSYRFLPITRGKSDGQVSREQFSRLERYLNRVLRDICQEMAAGNITADPFWRGPDKNACRYCDYAAACHFEPGRGGDCQRWLITKDARQFWSDLAEQDERDEQNEQNEQEVDAHAVCTE